MAATRNKRVTRRNGRKPRVLDVRSRGAVKAFENLIVQGPLTLVYVNAKWCGACHRFSKEVWSPLTKLKNKGLNLASVDSEYIGKTSLADVPRKFFPTLMLVGRDKKPAEFKDENGEPTNAMPRKETLAEDRETLSALVQAPLNHPLNVNTETLVNTIETPAVNEVVERTVINMPMPVNMSARRATLNTMPASPFESTNAINAEVLSMTPSASSVPLVKNRTIRSRTRSSVPDVASDLLASQSGSTTGTVAVLDRGMRGGGLLAAINDKIKSLDALIGMRKDKKTRKSKLY
jgi:hypothetical protein